MYICRFTSIYIYAHMHVYKYVYIYVAVQGPRGLVSGNQRHRRTSEASNFTVDPWELMSMFLVHPKDVDLRERPQDVQQSTVIGVIM